MKKMDTQFQTPTKIDYRTKINYNKESQETHKNTVKEEIL
jgi:hypothetical protein